MKKEGKFTFCLNGSGFPAALFTAHFPPRKIKRSFTLIELLIVIAIIAILSALLLPALSKARAYTVGIQCLSNIKQSGLTFQLYANDSGGWLYPAWHDPEKTAYFTLMKTLRYAPGSPVPFVAGKSGHISAVYRCPDARMRNESTTNSTYGFRTCGQIQSCYTQIHAQRPFMKRNTGALWKTWDRPSEMILLSDVLTRGYRNAVNKQIMNGHYQMDDNAENSFAGIPFFLHSGKCNVLFGDGHVKGILPKELSDSVRARNLWTYFTGSGIILGRYP